MKHNNKFWVNLLAGFTFLLLFSTCTSSEKEKSSEIKFSVSFNESQSAKPLDGRILLLLAKNDKEEPRFQINDGSKSQLIFGIDVDGLKPGEKAIVNAEVFGYPINSIKDIPAGDYLVQAVFNKYETFNLSTGHSVKLPPDKGEGQKWNIKPGNLYSTPQKINFDPGKNQSFEIELTNEIPPIEPPKDTKYIKHIQMKSEMLSKFWGRDMYLGAHVLLPEGFDEHPDARYPLAIMHGHFPSDFGGFRSTPPDPDLKPEYSARFGLEGYNKIVQQEEYNFYKQWTGPDFPRVIAIEIQHPTPYYDDSYAVNSASMGPYGDAITYELIPYIEEKFRGLGEGWARFVYGGSTGGWEALAVQVFYPDEYNGCIAACPDPIDFQAYTVVNIYEDKNAYYIESDFKKTKRPGHRDSLGHINSTIEDANHRELALATKGRSGDQWDIWQAVYSPMGEDGYPKPIWDKLTGEIDHEVAAYWKENYDLTYIMQRDWETLGPKLRGKLNIYCGDMDNYYLNNAVYITEKFLENTTNPYYEGEVDYGDRAEHCWNGDHKNPNAISRLRYHQMFIPKFVERIKKTAPTGADLSSWKY
ncbi:alpha/beta hydrolase-fold protein [Flexithrix dorotheae]|uniref:alpha/beta hydrolase-fold protein n=1 Tax=Flexithrix dorotheae TaxID=70993 RepID=UPI0003687ABB|nr:alpha/beta hydrolase-fold protein [Flexithrix dorotheae]